MVRRSAISISILVIGLTGIAWPVHGYFQAYGFFNPSNKYHDWFHETVWVQDLGIVEATKVLRRRPIRTSIAVRFPYPERDFVMTGKQWRKAFNAIESGKSDWYDSEIVRQRAEMEEHGPAMDLLAWMYEQGQGTDRDLRKAFMWYERAKMSGQVNLRGNPAKIFLRLKKNEKFLAQLQLSDDIERLEAEGKSGIKASLGIKGFESIKLHVLKEQRETAQLRKKRRYEKKKKAEEANR